MLPQIRDHDGRLYPYDEEKIAISIYTVAQSVGGRDKELASKLSKKVVKILNGHFHKSTVLSIEEVENAIEKLLIEEGHAKTAKAYILERQKRESEALAKEKLGVHDDLDLPINSLIVVKNKYLLKDEKGQVIETPKQWLRRVARALSLAEESNKRKYWEEKFYGIMERREFLPGGRTLANAGTVNGQLANCFVLPFEDNIEEIFEVVKESSILKKNGGGVGFSFSKIRPKGDVIATTTGKACGPIALMKVLDSCSEILLQDGGRRSGNMVVLSVSHPDVLDFINCKERDSELAQINYSLGVTDRFMNAVTKNKDWNLINPRTGQIVSKIKARSIFELAANHAWKNGDPGIIFLDSINRDNPTPHIGPIEAVNLCGEQPLLSYEACNLGSINLAKFVAPLNSPSTSLRVTSEEVNWERLGDVVKIATRMLDNVISVCRYPLAKVDRVVKANRKIGLGVLGWADALISMGIPYNSREALKLAEKVMKFIQKTSWETSERLGREKGSFPNFVESTLQKNGYKHFRNSTCTTIAPTGSISLVAATTSGIEPLFALSYFRKAMGDVTLPEVHPTLVSELSKIYSRAHLEILLEEIARTGSIQKIPELPSKLRRVFVTAMDISPSYHVLMQAAFQKYTDNAVSKTINLPQNATVKDVEDAFMLAYKTGCKGITIYRDKSKGDQVLNVGSADVYIGGGHPLAPREKGDICPECGSKMQIEEGCAKCPSCGWGKCSV